MQLLQFERSWEKAIAEQDRHFIEQLFEQTRFNEKPLVQFIPIRHALNYKGELLVTVLVHNFSTEVLTFHERFITCSVNDSEISHRFTLPQLTIAPKTSMPWTFIFPRTPANYNVNAYVTLL